ncbi:phosphatase 1 regulatory subunit SDS22-like protein [Nymphaea thermarum]|nr:phosphatase 1 regulatory subunit SDS22-like protein [Nymphaea thermarum]
MAKFSCFAGLLKKSKKGHSKSTVAGNQCGSLQVKLEKVDNSSKNGSFKTSFHVSILPLSTEEHSDGDVKRVGDMNCNLDDKQWHLQTFEAKKEEGSIVQAAYEGEDEDDDSPLACGGSPNIDLHLEGRTCNSHSDLSVLDSVHPDSSEKFSGDEAIQSGHLSDPGIYVRTGFTGSQHSSPRLKRSCSNLETGMIEKIIPSQFSSKSHSYDDLQEISCIHNAGIRGIDGSPLSVVTSSSADKVMLKRMSSSQLLPSRSRRVWWKLFLWSQRNLHRPNRDPCQVPRLAMDRKILISKEGYSSDTQDVCEITRKGKEAMKTESSKLKNVLCSNPSDGLRYNQWMAFSTQPSSQNWIDDWVHTSIDADSVPPADVLETTLQHDDSEETLTPSSEVSGSPETCSLTPRRPYLPNEVLHANSIIQAMNPLSTVAHVSGMGLKVIPPFSPFCSLRAINLSSNLIVHITPGSLPKSLHTLNLSRNKIVTIEGLRELTRLRVLDLSYNRISRIGHGLSNCTIIKELYLAGNKISDVEGLHRLLKLTVLDLSFNKITTAKAFGQLVANYSTLVALNLLGNPIQTNLGEDHIRKAVCSLLPKLAYLNKQPIKPVRAREAATDSVAKAALGNGSWSSRRSATRRSSQGSSSLKGRAAIQRFSSTGGRPSKLSGREKHSRSGTERLSMRR